ncbi:MAG: trypsin-like peptidase domain-containing protein [Dehalococcoidia bacterium]|nr:trypsin-like peptidase domain-containing protein [Dehalococcoidia bacterium]
MAAILERLIPTIQLSDEAAQLAERVRASVVVVRGSRPGGGSGVVWNDQGLVITNYHVVLGDQAEVIPANGVRLSARAFAHSESLDLAALQIEGEMPSGSLTPASIGDSTRLRAGDLVVAVGNPLGERNAVTLGVVSGVGAPAWFKQPREVVQVAITLRPGNSGGALADMHGSVVGIPNMVVNTGMALAIPSHIVERFILETHQVRGYFGVGGQPVELPHALTDALGLTSPLGIMLMAIEPGSPAEAAGLTIGDILVDVSTPGGRAGPAGLLAHLGSIPAGQPAELTIIRAGQLRRYEVTPR